MCYRLDCHSPGHVCAAREQGPAVHEGQPRRQPGELGDHRWQAYRHWRQSAELEQTDFIINKFNFKVYLKLKYKTL